MSTLVRYKRLPWELARSTIWSTLLFFSILSGGAVCAAKVEPTNIRQVEINIEPLAFYFDNQPEGIFYQLGRDVASRLQLEHNFNIVPWNRVEMRLKKGLADLEISPSFIDRNDIKTRISPSIGTMEYAMYSYKTNAQHTNRLIIGVPKSSTMFFREYLGEWVDTVGFEQYEEGYALLRNKNIDGIVINQVAFDAMLKDNNLNREEFHIHWTKSFPIYLWLSNNSPSIEKSDLAVVAQQIKDEDVLQKIIENCLPQYATQKACRFDGKASDNE